MKRSIFSLGIASCLFQGWTPVAIAQTPPTVPPIPNSRQTQSELPKPIPTMVMVSISATGDVYLEKEQVSSEQLATALQKRMAENPNTQIVLYGASEARYGQVMQVLGEIQKVVGSRVSLAVLKSDQPSIPMAPAVPEYLLNPIRPKLSPLLTPSDVPPLPAPRRFPPLPPIRR